MDLLYVLAGGGLVIAGYLIAKIDFNKEKRSKEREQTMQKIQDEAPEPQATAPAEHDEDPNKIPQETQLADMQSYDPLKAVKKGRA